MEKERRGGGKGGKGSRRRRSWGKGGRGRQRGGGKGHHSESGEEVMQYCMYRQPANCRRQGTRSELRFVLWGSKLKLRRPMGSKSGGP